MTSVWLAIHWDWDSATPHAVFEREVDARLYAKAAHVDVQEIPLYAADESPKILMWWRAEAEVLIRGGRRISLKEPGERPTSFSEFDARRDDPRLKPCTPYAEQEHTDHGTVLHISAQGSDREAVLASVVDRHRQAMQGQQEVSA